MRVRLGGPYLQGRLSLAAAADRTPPSKPLLQTKRDVSQAALPEPGTSGGESSKRRRLTSPDPSDIPRINVQAAAATEADDGNLIEDIDDMIQKWEAEEVNVENYVQEVLSAGVAEVLPEIEIQDIGAIIPVPELDLSLSPAPQSLNYRQLMSDPALPDILLPNLEEADGEVCVSRVIDMITLDEEGERTSRVVERTLTRPVETVDLTVDDQEGPNMVITVEDDEVIFVTQAKGDSSQSQAKVSPTDIADEDDEVVILAQVLPVSCVEEEPQEPQEPPHPLLNHVVLTHLMRYHTFEELKRNRLVCQEWNFVASNIVKHSHAPLCLYSQSDIDRFLRLARFSNFRTSPFGSFKLNYVGLGSEGFRIFSVLGSLMIRLGIYFREPVRVLGGVSPYEKLVLAFDDLPNLQHLELLCSGGPEAELNPTGYEVDYEYLSRGSTARIKLPSLTSLQVSTLHTFGLLFDLFGRAGNLSKIQLSDHRYQYEDRERRRMQGDNSDFIDALRTGVRPGRPLDLTLANDLGPDHLSILQEAGFRFRRLWITGGFLQVWDSEDLFKRFLLAQVRTLRVLRLNGTFLGPDSFDPSRIFGFKPFLGSNLTIQDTTDTALEVKRGRTGTLVRLGTQELSNLLESRESVRSPDVVEVSVSFTLISARNLGRLGYLFPGLKRLELGLCTVLTAAQADVIFGRLGTLEGLKITLMPVYVDSTLTGLENPTKVNAEFSRWKTKYRNELCSTSTRPELLAQFLRLTGKEPRASLRNMQRLKKFDLSLRLPENRRPGPTNYPIRCATVYLGFLGIPPLKTLILNSAKIAPTGRKALLEYHESVEFN